jgi:hypothetical protein
MANQMRTLDIAEPQVLVNYPNDADGFVWHHRILLYRVKAGTWVTLTPTLELQTHNLLTTPHVVLARASRFPAAYADEVFCHDPLSKADLAHEKRRARTHAAILGEEDLDGLGTAVWVISDIKDSKFGEVIPPEMVEDGAVFTSLQERGVVEWDSAVRYCEQILDSEVEKYIRDKKDKELDARTLGIHMTGDKQYISTRDAYPLLTEETRDDWPRPGPRIVKEYIGSVVEGPGNWVTYQTEWERNSGVAEGSAVCHAHRAACEVMRLAIEVDQLNVSSLACFEQLLRKVAQDEMAVDRNPKHPDYSGLALAIGSPTQASGAAMTQKWTEWLAGRQKDRAIILKQARLLREEREADWKRKRDSGKGKKGKGASKGNKEKASGGAEGAAEDG